MQYYEIMSAQSQFASSIQKQNGTSCIQWITGFTSGMHSLVHVLFENMYF